MTHSLVLMVMAVISLDSMCICIVDSKGVLVFTSITVLWGCCALWLTVVGYTTFHFEFALVLPRVSM